VVEERLQVVPAAPVADEERIDVLAGGCGRPRPPQVVEREVRPSVVVIVDAFGRVGDPPPKSPRARDVDE